MNQPMICPCCKKEHRAQADRCHNDDSPQYCCCNGHNNDCGKPGDGNTGNPNRPGKPPGTDTGRLGDGTPLNPGDLKGNQPPGSWSGPRKDLYLPFLFMRANAGDVGTRPVVGPFWESPDILIVAGVEPAMAPKVPAQLGQTALAGKPNTVYAHVWNFGQAQAPQVVVEFYWCDPSLGINPGSAHMIGQTVISLGARGSGQSHKLVKCPEAWVPTFLNGGHECLLVRVWDICSDTLGSPAWDASINRHLAQRNIHVVPAPELMKGMKIVGSPAFELLPSPLLLKVGPLYGMPAQVNVTRIAPNNMPWLQLHTGTRGLFPAIAPPTGKPMLSKPGQIGGGLPTGSGADVHTVNGDDQQVAFSTSDSAPAPGHAHVYRVSASQGGQLFGGYTVVLMG